VLSLGLELINWRLFEGKSVLLGQKNTLIWGENGSGKTTILSGLYGLYTGEAWPGTVWRQQIKTGGQYFGIKTTDAPDWYISGLISPQGRVITRYSKEIPENWNYTALSYVPDENRWLVLSRSAKLNILDQSLSSIYGKEYQDALKKLEKSVLSKTRLLKHYLENGYQDPILEEELHEMIMTNSQILWGYRKKFFLELYAHIPSFTTWIESDIYQTKINYIISMGSQKLTGLEDILLPTAEQTGGLERRVGRVMYGAHRDDFGFEFNDQPAENFLSRGENRAFVIFFKQYVRSLLKGRVIWLLDDFFNEFDSKREVSVLAQLVTNPNDWVVATATRRVDGFTNYVEV
jgi:recombinational DNA repair ATPase RecF